MVKSNSLQSNGKQRGEEARRNLIEAGIEAFSTQGYEAASTRSIVEKAGVNLGAIPYYFKNKEGLYHAVAEHIALYLDEPEINAAIARIDSKTKSPSISKEQALDLMHELFEAFMTTLLSADRPDLWIRFIFRELAEPSSVFDILNEKVVRKTINPCAALISKILDKPIDDPECTVRAFSLFGQILIFRAMKQVTLKSLHWDDFDNDRLELIRTVIHQQVNDALRAQSKRS
ncbi:MAG: CerR family C-terminal domain-containing protein [Cyanobacteria bacterium J06634_6]